VTANAAPAFPRSVGIMSIPELRHVLSDLVALIRRRTGAAVHLYVRSEQEAAYYESINDGRFASIAIGDMLFRDFGAGSEGGPALVAEARRFETMLGGTLNRLAVMQRQIGRGFMIGGYYHPRSPMSESGGYLAVCNAYVKQLRLWEREFEQKKIELFLGGLPEVARFCRARGVPFRLLRHARYKNQHYWSPDEYGSMPGLEAVWHATEIGADEFASLTEPYLTEIALRRQFVGDARLARVLRDTGYTLLQYAWWRYKRYDKARQTDVVERMMYFWRRWRALKRVTDRAHLPLAALKNARYVFLPLQTEPEATLLQNSPEYFFQLEAIHAVARALPVGSVLAVKEGLLAVGRRPKGFYDQIARLPNVVLVNMLEQGIDVARHAAAVVTVSSTAGMEALIMGKPVILLGRHNYFDFLPHAHKVKDAGELPALLRSVLGPGGDVDRARRDGARFLKALVAHTFSMGAYDYLDLRSYTADDVAAVFAGLCRSLGCEGVAKEAMAA
jgi:hypothetical protein